MDGTLLDTIESIRYCGNRAMKKAGLDDVTVNEYKKFVGDGISQLVTRMIESKSEDSAFYYKGIKAEYERLFKTNSMYKVEPYPGIRELLKKLKEKEVFLGVYTNKPHERAVEIIDQIFPDLFDAVIGQSEEKEKKPDPWGIFEMLKIWGLGKEEAIYLGDTSTDMATGKNAGIYTVGVLWGFRERKELEESGADLIIQHPLDLLKHD